MAHDDKINSPDHYTAGGIECIDYMRAKLTREQFIGYLKGNVLKYVSRSEFKDSNVDDYKKAQWHLNKLIDLLEESSGEALIASECLKIRKHVENLKKEYRVIDELETTEKTPFSSEKELWGLCNKIMRNN